MTRFGWRSKEGSATRCRVSEEWCGIFIGRRYCSTHDTRWDTGGDCPKKGAA